MDDEVIVLAFFTVLIIGIGILMNHLNNTKKTVSKKGGRKSKKR